MSVADWLGELGLERYLTAFIENDVDAQLLPNLTADDLRDLGISSVGHRRILLDAIAALRSAATPGGSETTAELRPLSVMFCDLIGFTALSARLDPEALREVIRAYQACVSATIQRFDGFIARYVGDGVLIYFGWPEAHETDAERAVRAGLAVAAEVSNAPRGGEIIHVRVGIATGLVVVGEPIGTGDSRQQTAIGETPNLAARLQALAQADQVVIDAATHQQVGGLFECQHLGTVELKGLPLAVPAWQVICDGALESRFEALHGGTMMQLVGREEELELLYRSWKQAAAGEGRIVLVRGEPGIGKSRLLVALEERLGEEPRASLRYYCSPLHQGNVLYPVVARLEREAGIASADSVEQRLRKLEAMLALTDVSPDDIALFAAMMGIPGGDRYPLPDLSPQRLKERTFELLQRRLSGLIQRQPVLILVEDTHWADQTSLELFDALANRIAGIPVLLVMSFRPEFEPPWLGRPTVSMISLSRLDRRESAALAAQVTATHALPEAVMERIIAQTDGVPLFIEELTKAIVETAPDGSPSVVAVPRTLQASLMARLDRLPAARQVAQIGAVIGREFPHTLMTQVSGLSPERFDRGLEELVAAGLVFRRGSPPDAVYTFKHALVQETAYESLLKSRRQRIHRLIAETVQDNLPEWANAEPQIVAHHFTQSGEFQAAAKWWLQSARLTLAKLAPTDALAQVERGLNVLGGLPEEEWRWQTEVELQLVAGNALMVTHGHAAARTGAALGRAVELCERLPSSKLRMAAQFAHWSHLMLRGDLSAAVGLADNMLSAASRDGDVQWRLAGLRARGIVKYLLGSFTESIDSLTKFLALWNDGDASVGLGLAHDPGSISVYCYRSYGLHLVGRIADARRDAAAAMEGARLSGHHLIVAQAMFTEACIDYFAEADAAARQRLHQTLEYSTEHNVTYFKMFASGYLSTIEGREGNVDRALCRVSEAIEIARASGTYAYLPGFLAREGEFLTLAGRIDEAYGRFAEAFALEEQTAAHWDKSTNKRLFARTLLADGRAPEAEAQLRQAVSMAEEQGAWLSLLDVACDLAPILAKSGQTVEAIELLTRSMAAFANENTVPILERAHGILQRFVTTNA